MKESTINLNKKMYIPSHTHQNEAEEECVQKHVRSMLVRKEKITITTKIIKELKNDTNNKINKKKMPIKKIIMIIVTILD